MKAFRAAHRGIGGDCAYAAGVLFECVEEADRMSRKLSDDFKSAAQEMIVYMKASTSEVQREYCGGKASAYETAAGWVEELEEENARLREALQTFVSFHSGHVLPLELRFAMAEARKAIEGKGEA